MKESEGEVVGGGYKIMRVILLLKWERLGLLITGNEDASTEEEAGGRQRIEDPEEQTGT